MQAKADKAIATLPGAYIYYYVGVDIDGKVQMSDQNKVFAECFPPSETHKRQVDEAIQTII